MTRIVVAVVALLALMAGLWGVYELGASAGRAQVQVRWDAQVKRSQADAAKQYQAQAEANARESFRRTERQAQLEEVKDARIAALNRTVDVLRGELRTRPARPDPGPVSTASADPAPVAPGTGAGLYLQDADFLVGEAARAQRVLIERDACFDKYDALRK